MFTNKVDAQTLTNNNHIYLTLGWNFMHLLQVWWKFKGHDMLHSPGFFFQPSSNFFVHALDPWGRESGKKFFRSVVCRLFALKWGYTPML